MVALSYILCAAIGYLLGGIQTGLIVARATRNIDLRKHGSGSSGATNALRVLGKQSALFTLLGDFAKGIIAACLGLLIMGWHGGMIAALAVVVGHIWPVFYNFRGGKGAATSLGALLVLLPIQTLILIALGLLIIALTKMVSMASIAAAVAFVALACLAAYPQQDWFLAVFSVLLSALVIFAHRANIGRIIHGTEAKINLSVFREKIKKK